MERREDVDAWADALLDQHRSAPRGVSKHLNEPAPLHELPPAVRLMMKFGGNHPTREQAERMRRSGERFATFQKWSSVFEIIAIVGLAAFVLVFLSAF